MPRWVDCRRVTFKYGLGDEFIEVLKTLRKLGLDRTEPLRVNGAEVSPRDVVAAALARPDDPRRSHDGEDVCRHVGDRHEQDGSPREVYLHHVVDNAETWGRDGAQAVVWQTAINPVIALELLASGAWSGSGVLGPEAFPARPFLDLLGEHGSPWGLDER